MYAPSTLWRRSWYGPPCTHIRGRGKQREEEEEGRRRCITFWKMKRDGKVLEMSSLIRSRLDSLSATDAASTTDNTFRIMCVCGGGGGWRRRRPTALAVVD